MLSSQYKLGLPVVSVENLACNVRNASEKAHFVSDITFVVFYLHAYMEIISMSLEVAFPLKCTISP